jgi:pimeloyl-ACP methyl ester carboxylesterase
MNTLRSVIMVIVATILATSFAQHSRADDGDQLLRVDHYVGVKSIVPAITGQTTEIYVREVVQAGVTLRHGAAPLVLFIHGAGTPSEVAFDVEYRDYSWMAYLARAGFDVFAMDNTGYGRSTRPTIMNDPCNLSAEQQVGLAVEGHAEPCTASYRQNMTTIASDWNEIGAVVDHLLALRHQSQLSIAAWSLGGPRAGGYAALHADKVRKLVLLAPAYDRKAVAIPPARLPADGLAMNIQSRGALMELWDSQVGCAGQYEPATFDAVWSSMLASDPVGATWGAGVRRAPQVTNWGWTTTVVAATQIPTLMITGAHDKQVPPAQVEQFYDDLGAKQKVLIDLNCSSHNAMWERNHLLLFQASLEWLTRGTVNGVEQGIVRLGY